MTKKGSYRYSKGAYVFTWEPGDGYIEILIDGRAIDVINVWSYSSGGGENTIGSDRPSFVAECDDWWNDNKQYIDDHRMIPG